MLSPGGPSSYLSVVNSDIWIPYKPCTDVYCEEEKKKYKQGLNSFFFLKYPLALNLETDGEEQRVNDTFPDCPVCDKSQHVVH